MLVKYNGKPLSVKTHKHPNIGIFTMLSLESIPDVIACDQQPLVPCINQAKASTVDDILISRGLERTNEVDWPAAWTNLWFDHELQFRLDGLPHFSI
jgi:hypothetical protein